MLLIGLSMIHVVFGVSFMMVKHPDQIAVQRCPLEKLIKTNREEDCAHADILK